MSEPSKSPSAAESRARERSHEWNPWNYRGLGNSERVCRMCGFTQPDLMDASELPFCGEPAPPQSGDEDA